MLVLKIFICEVYMNTIKDKGNLTAKSNKIILGLGGVDNIVEGHIDNCATRLRIQVKNMEYVNEKLLRRQGALGFIRLQDNHIQVVFLNVHTIADEIRRISALHQST